MIDCALLTNKGILFCFLPPKVFQNLTEQVDHLGADIEISFEIKKENGDTRVVTTRPEHILVRYYFGKAQRG